MPRRFSFKGHYKGWYFRSLRELSFVLECEENGQTWRSAECEEFSVEYIDVYGHKKKHWADLFVDNHIIVEVKPRKYQHSKTVKLKAEAMEEFCKSKGYTYMMVAPRKLSKAKLQELIDSKAIQISDENSFKKYMGRRKV